MRFGRMAPAALACIALAAAACSENLDNTVGCPELCPNQGIEVINVTIDPVVMDSTVNSVQTFGTEPYMLLASRGDTLDSRVVIRFDSLPQRYKRVASDTTTTAITVVDSAFVQLRLELSERQAAGPVTVSAYDIDTAGDDTSVAALVPLFSQDRLLGSRTFVPVDLKDSVRIPLSNAAVLAKAQANARLRIGFRISAGTGQFHVFATEAGVPALLSFRVSADTAIRPLTFTPFSRTPANSVEQQLALSDFRLLVRTPPGGPPQSLLVGALPSKRTYMRFLIPSSILDSSSVVRATLLLTQRPNRGFGPRDTVLVVTHVGIAGRAITDPEQASRLIAAAEFTQVDSLRVAASDSGLRELDIVPILRVWRARSDTLGARYIVLRSAREGVSAAQAWFFSTEATPGLRPRLRISYTPTNPFGLP